MSKQKKAAKKKAAKKKSSKKKDGPTGKKTPATTATGSDKKQQPGKTTITPAPTAGKKVRDFEKTLDELIAADEEHEQELREISDPPKTTRGRPRKTETEPASSLKQKANPLWPPVLKIPFDVWAETEKIEELRITDKEAELLALPITQLIDYYLPQLPEIAIAWFGLISAGYSVLGPRRQIIMQRRQDKSAPGPSTGPSHPGGPTKTIYPSVEEATNTVRI